ncbi:MAG: fibronectin type III domain-containing protein, partial [Deltaproteobacteria bacterium]|nr:fibronectin type III domain-containing protein [Deltaproteobacteria bacterium]
MSSNRLTQLVAALLILIFFAIAGCGGEQDAPPSPGTIIDFTNITPTSLTVNWTKATDDNTLQPYLEYKAVYHIYDIIGTVNAALRGRDVPLIIENSDGEEERITWVQDNTSIDVKDLDDGIEYYFNVVVRDRYWNASVYRSVSAK